MDAFNFWPAGRLRLRRSDIEPGRPLLGAADNFKLRPSRDAENDFRSGVFYNTPARKYIQFERPEFDWADGTRTPGKNYERKAIVPHSAEFIPSAGRPAGRRLLVGSLDEPELGGAKESSRARKLSRHRGRHVSTFVAASGRNLCSLICTL